MGMQDTANRNETRKENAMSTATATAPTATPAAERNSTWAAQFLGAFRLAKAGHAAKVRAGIEAKRAYIMAQPGGQAGIEAVEAGIQAAEINMGESDALAWAAALR